MKKTFSIVGFITALGAGFYISTSPYPSDDDRPAPTATGMQTGKPKIAYDETEKPIAHPDRNSRNIVIDEENRHSNYLLTLALEGQTPHEKFERLDSLLKKYMNPTNPSPESINWEKLKVDTGLTKSAARTMIEDSARALLRTPITEEIRTVTDLSEILTRQAALNYLRSDSEFQETNATLQERFDNAAVGTIAAPLSVAVSLLSESFIPSDSIGSVEKFIATAEKKDPRILRAIYQLFSVIDTLEKRNIFLGVEAYKPIFLATKIKMSMHFREQEERKAEERLPIQTSGARFADFPIIWNCESLHRCIFPR